MAPTSLLTTAVVLALAGQSIAEGISLEPASIPKIVSATFSGSGCPSGSVELSAGGEWHWDNWTLNLHRFTAEDGREADQRTRSANCQIQVHLASGPPGWQLAIGEVSARGFASILEGGSMSASATSYWSQEALSSTNRTVTYRNEAKTEVSNMAVVNLDFGDNAAWSRCIDEKGDVGSVNLNFRVSVDKGAENGHAFFGGVAEGVAGSEPPPTTTVWKSWRWVWRRCPEA